MLPTPVAPTATRCALPFEGAGYINERSRALDADRWYTYIPPGLDPAAKHPLMVLLHQQGHTGEILLDQGGFQPIADRHGVIVVAPTESDFDAWSPHRQHVDRVVFMIEEVSAQLCIDDARIYGVGHAGGAGVLPYVACRRGLAAFATTLGACPPARNHASASRTPRF